MAASQVRPRSSSPEPSPLDLAAAQFDDNSDYDEEAEREAKQADQKRDARPHGPGSISVDFGGLLPAPGLLIKEDATHGCGGRTWPAGMLLGRHLLRYRRDNLGDACVLELGAGGGLVALAVAKGCAITQPVLMTDMAIMVPLMEHNIALNGVQDKAVAAVLNWGEPIPNAITAAKPSVILAADLAYLESCFPLLLRTFTDLLEINPDAVVYFCQKRRRRADLQFIKSARKLFDVREPEDNERAVFERQRMFLLEFRSRRGVPRRRARQEAGVMERAKVDSSGEAQVGRKGCPVPRNDTSIQLRNGEGGGLSLLSDTQLIETLAHFARERIPERVVHAEAAGTYGFLECTHDCTDMTDASFLNTVGKKSPVLLRISTVGAESGSADTVRDIHGWSTSQHQVNE